MNLAGKSVELPSAIEGSGWRREQGLAVNYLAFHLDTDISYGWLDRHEGAGLVDPNVCLGQDVARTAKEILYASND